MIKDDFPILTRKIHGKPLVYLDNAATSQKPQAVIDALSDYYERTNANVHRGIHTLAEEATRLYEEARDKTVRFINAASREEIIFVRNTTEAVNLVAQSWAREHLYPGDEIVVSIMEHHSNFVPWQQLALDRGVMLKIVDIDEEGRLALRSNAKVQNSKSNDLESLISPRTKLIAVTHASNVLGTINDIQSVVRMARPRGILTFVDGAQAVPHSAVDVQALGVDFYAFSSHKMLGPTGVGVLYGRKAILETMRPYQTGGDMIKRVTIEKTEWNELPWKFEAGTPNIADVIAFGVAIEYLAKIGFDVIARHEQELGAYCLERLRAIDGLTLYGPQEMQERVGVFSFNLEGIHAHDAATVLDEEGIAIRSGHHCAQPLMERLHVPATARASLYLYNVKEDVDRLAQGIKKAVKIFRSP